MTFGIAECREFATAFYQHPEWREDATSCAGWC